jgi:hypothetical protein
MAGHGGWIAGEVLADELTLLTGAATPAHAALDIDGEAVAITLARA